MVTVQNGGLFRMQRSVASLILSVMSIGTVWAGQIQVGGVNGLTAGTVSASAGSAEKGYDPRLFLALTNGSTSPVPYTGYQQMAGAAGTFTDSAHGVTFSAINDGVGGGNWSNNFWDIGVDSMTGSSLTVAVDLVGVQYVYTMLNEIFGAAGNGDAQVTFDYLGHAPVVVLLTASGPTAAGQIRNSVNCASNACAAPLTNAASGALTGATIGGVPVTTSSVYTGFTYNTTPGNNYAKGTTGSIYLDDQGFNLSAFSGFELLDVKITNLSSTDDLALSAITVVTPEPSTMFLLVAGLGAIGATRRRRRA